MREKPKKVQVTFTSEQWNLIKKLKGEFGKGDAEVIRNIILAWLSEKSLITTNVKRKYQGE